MDFVISNNQFKNNQYLFSGIFIRNLLMIYLWRQRNYFFVNEQQIPVQLNISEIHRELGEQVMLLSNRTEVHKMKVKLN